MMMIETSLLRSKSTTTTMPRFVVAFLASSTIPTILCFTAWLTYFANARNRVTNSKIELQLEEIFVLRKNAVLVALFVTSTICEIFGTLWRKFPSSSWAATSILRPLLLGLLSPGVSFMCLARFFTIATNKNQRKDDLSFWEADLKYLIERRPLPCFCLLISCGVACWIFWLAGYRNSVYAITTTTTSQQPQEPQSTSTAETSSPSHNNNKNNTTSWRRIVQVLLDILYFLLVAFFTAYALTMLFSYHYSETVRPYLKSIRWDKYQPQHLAEKQQTYYQRFCNHPNYDLSTTNTSNLIVAANASSSQIVDTVLEHGAAVIPNLLTEDQANKFRNFAIFRNKKLSPAERVFVHKGGKKRSAFALRPQDDPIITQVLKSIFGNVRLKESLEAFLGEDPAFIKLQTISSRPGAIAQQYHPDTNTYSSVKTYARSFYPHFSLFIYAQNTTKTMGPTWLCPGTQYCNTTTPRLHKQCQPAFSYYDTTSNKWIVKAGDAVLMNQNTVHRGGAYTQEFGKDRVMLVLTFTARPQTSSSSSSSASKSQEEGSGTTTNKLKKPLLVVEPGKISSSSFLIPDRRQVAIGTPLSSYGLTYHDLSDPTKYLSTWVCFLRRWGLWKYPESNWSHDYITSLWGRIASEGSGFQRLALKDRLKFWRRSGFPYNILLQHVVSNELPDEENIKTRGAWDVWIEESLNKARQTFRKAITRFILLPILCSGTLHLFISGPGHSSLRPSRMFLLALLALVFILAGTAILNYLIEGTSTVKMMRERILLDRHDQPGLPPEEPKSIRSAVTPSRDDILIGCRYDSVKLLAFNRFLDYHRGNRIWRERRKDLFNISGLPLNLQKEAARQVLFPTVMPITSTDQASPQRMLVQSPSTGQWIPLKGDAAIELSRKVLMMDSVPLLRVLDESVQFMLAYIRYDSRLRGTSIARCSIVRMEKLQRQILGHPASTSWPSKKPPKNTSRLLKSQKSTLERWRPKMLHL